ARNPSPFPFREEPATSWPCASPGITSTFPALSILTPPTFMPASCSARTRRFTSARLNADLALDIREPLGVDFELLVSASPSHSPNLPPVESIHVYGTFYHRHSRRLRPLGICHHLPICAYS